MSTLKRVIIFGATSAIAEHTARQLASSGASICCVARDAEKLENIVQDLNVRASDKQVITGLHADLTDLDRHETLIQQATEQLGGLDTALIIHGTLPDQEQCQASVATTLKEIDTNATSTISLLTLLANQFEQQNHGSLAVVSSVAGDRGRQSNYVYGAAKGMVSLFLQGLRNRLASSNVRVVTIKPGFVDTPMTAAFDKKGFLWAQPDTIATGIIRSIQKRKDVVYLPWFWLPIMLIIKSIPEKLFKRLSL